MLITSLIFMPLSSAPGGRERSCATPPCVQVSAAAWLLQPPGPQGETEGEKSLTVNVTAASDVMNYRFNCVHLIPLLERCD